MTFEDGAPGSVVHDGVANALLGWAPTAVVAVAAVERLATGRLVWGLFWLLFVGTFALPAVLSRDWTVVVPWPLPAGAFVAVALRTTGLSTDVAGYLAITTLALVAVFELDRFTQVDMIRRFTVGFAVLTTMALQAVWTVVQFLSDWWLGTTFLGSLRELQLDIVFVTVVALVVGGLMVGFVDHLAPARSTDRPTAAEESS